MEYEANTTCLVFKKDTKTKEGFILRKKTGSNRNRGKLSNLGGLKNSKGQRTGHNLYV